ncbi:MAG: response regulator [Cyanobacteria bacterium P01_A01_bin.17]
MERNIFNPYELLIELSSSQATGVLKASYGSAVWHIYLSNGDLQYADCAAHTLAQLSYLLCRQGLERALPILKEVPQVAKPAGEASQISHVREKIQQSMCWLDEMQALDSMQAKQLIEDVTQDALESFFWLREGQASWKKGMSTPNWVASVLSGTPLLEVADTIKFLQRRMKGWQGCSSSLWSPYQRPYLLDFRDINKPVEGGKLAPAALTKLAQLMSRGLSIRLLSVLIKQDELHVAQLLAPYIEQGVIFLRNPQPPFDALPKIPRVPKPPVVQAAPSKEAPVAKIVCIDDSPIILAEIERFLADTRYAVTTVNDPIQASSIIFRIKPDLILLDITMPRVNGYRLCSLLRSSAMFDETPIIMVTGNTGLIDKARARLAGATDYFTKPFTQPELLSLVERYLSSHNARSA